MGSVLKRTASAARASASRRARRHVEPSAHASADSTRVGVRELRQNLSVYLDRVKRGASLTVTEHGHVVAMLSPVTRALSLLERLIAEGRATPASKSLRDLPPPRPARPGDRASEDIISEMRNERLP